MSKIPEELHYTEEHEYVKPMEKNVVRIGITDYMRRVAKETFLTGHLLLQLCRHAIDGFTQGAELVGAPHVDAGVQPPGRDVGGGAHHFLDRPRHASHERQPTDHRVQEGNEQEFEPRFGIEEEGIGNQARG